MTGAVGGAPAADAPLLDGATLARLGRLSVVQLDAVLSGLAGRPLGPLSVRGGDVVDHRAYAPGDDLRHIDWNVYARLDQAVVRLAQDEAPVGVAILVDTSASMSGPVLRAAQRVAALLGAVALLRADVVQVVSLAGHGAVAGPALSGAHALAALVAGLEDVVAGGGSGLAAGLVAARAAGAPAGVGVLVTDALLPSDERDAAVAELARAARTAAVVHVVAADDGLAGDGAVELTDSETGERLSVVLGAGARADYRARRGALAMALAAACTARGVGYARLDADEDPFALLARLADAGVLRGG